MDGGARWAAVTWLYRRLDGLWVAQPGPDLMPQLPVVGNEHHGIGRPRVVVTDPARVEFAARSYDLLGVSHARVAGQLRGDSDVKAAKRDRDRGRQHLAARGVIPWCIWPTGKLPPKWWEAGKFTAAIDQWRREALDSPAPLLRSSLTQALDDFTRRVTPSRKAIEQALLVPPPPSIRAQRMAELERTPWRPPAR